MGLLDTAGNPLPLHLEGADNNAPAPLEQVLVLTEAEQSFTFHQLESAPIPSLLRQFSAPV